MTERARTLGVVLAGGENRRYGAHKALATVGGRRIVDRVVEALEPCAGSLGIVANEPGPYAELGLPLRSDVRPGTGALGGLLTAVTWARERSLAAALVIACDMPFVPAALLEALRRATDRDAACVPESGGPRGVEPLCAAYGTGCEGAIAAALDRGERAIVSFFDAVELRRLPIERVRSFGEPERMFLNVNRPEDRERAESFARSDAGRPDDAAARTRGPAEAP